MINQASITGLVSLLNDGHRHVLPKGQVVGNIWGNLGLAYVESGYLKRYLITHEGNQSILVIYGPGYILPLTPAYRELVGLELYEGEEIFYYEAMSKAVIRTISMDILKNYCQENPAVYKELFYIAGTRLNMVIFNSETMSLGNSYRRIAHQLVYFADHFGQASGKSIKILLPLTNTEIASLINITRETVSRCISRLKKKGIIKAGANIIVLDMDKLRKEVYK